MKVFLSCDIFEYTSLDFSIIASESKYIPSLVALLDKSSTKVSKLS